MKNDNLTRLIDAINHISLNNEDLMDSVLNFSKIYCKNNPKDALLIDKFFAYNQFLNQAVMSAREAIVLAMNSITLDEQINFKEVMTGCINIDAQRFAEDEVCLDDATKKVMRDFLKELRKELFSRLYSQNKDFYKVSKISKEILQQRFNQFMAEQF